MKTPSVLRSRIRILSSAPWPSLGPIPCWVKITPKMKEAVVSREALKILIPLSREKTGIVEVMKEPLPHFVMTAAYLKKEVMNRV